MSQKTYHEIGDLGALLDWGDRCDNEAIIVSCLGLFLCQILIRKPDAFARSKNRNLAFNG